MPHATGERACSACQSGLRYALQEIRELFVELVAAPALRRRSSPRAGGSSRSADPPAPVDLERLSLTAAGSVSLRQSRDQIGGPPVVAVLRSWEDYWRELRGDSERPRLAAVAAEVSAALHYLDAHLPWAIESSSTLPDFTREIRALLRRLRYCAYGPPDEPLRQASQRCPVSVDDAGGRCGGRLRVELSEGAVVCERCRSWWRWGRALEVTAREWLTVPEVEHVLLIPERTRQRWAASEGWQTRRVGRAVQYRTADVLATLRRYEKAAEKVATSQCSVDTVGG